MGFKHTFVSVSFSSADVCNLAPSSLKYTIKKNKYEIHVNVKGGVRIPLLNHDKKTYQVSCNRDSLKRYDRSFIHARTHAYGWVGK